MKILLIPVFSAFVRIEAGELVAVGNMWTYDDGSEAADIETEDGRRVNEVSLSKLGAMPKPRNVVLRSGDYQPWGDVA